ncbi:hypothetical protein, partial [Oceanithermus desulfurans]
MSTKVALEEARKVLEALDYEVWENEDGLEAERRQVGLIYRVYYAPAGDLKLEKVRSKPEEVREALLADHHGQFVRQEEVRESFFTVCKP